VQASNQDAGVRVGWIGTGVMGAPMAGHLLDAGYQVAVFNRSRERADGLVARGARWCDSPAELAASSDVVATMLGYPADVRETVLGTGGVLEAIAPGGLLIDLTTSEPSLAVEIAAAAAARKVDAVDAPVSGGDVGARDGRLVIMTGASEQAFERARPLLAVFARTVSRLGGPGAGQHTKMVNQIAIAAGMMGLCEALLYAQRAGLDVAAVIETIEGGAAGSWSLSNYGPRIIRGDLAPGFRIEHFVKDLGIALTEARRLDLALPGTALAEQLYLAARSQSLGANGIQALTVVLERLSAAP
jgi:3-hydroxyisobutyrate dehydrogenase